jgi:hypothetical protein
MTKSGKKVCVIAVVRINPGTLVVYIAVERIKGGHQTERASPSAVSPPGTRDAVSSPRSTWTHHPAIIKATGPHHPAPTSTLAGDCSGRARSCPPATQHRKPSDPQCEPYENQLNNIPVKLSTCVKLFPPPLRSYTASCTNPGLLNKRVVTLPKNWLFEVTMKKKTRQIALIIGNSRNSCLLMVQNLKNF